MKKEKQIIKSEIQVIKKDNINSSQNEEQKEKGQLSIKDDPLLSSFINSNKSGGVYIPPYRMAPLLESIRQKNDPTSIEYQKMMWDLLKKSLNGIINKVNTSNIQNIIVELFNENLIRGKGLLVKSITKAQMTSPKFTQVYAAVISVINTRLPDIGNLIIQRYLISFKKAYKRNNKIQCVATTKMIAHLINQSVNEYVLAFEILQILLSNATNDSIELACDFILECGLFLSEQNINLLNLIFESLRKLLQEGGIDQRVQFIIENLFEERKKNFKDHEMNPELDLVHDEDKIIHRISLDSELNGEEYLDVFKYDDKYEEHENVWNMLKKEILGENEEEEQENNNIEDNEKAIKELVTTENNNNNIRNNIEEDEDEEEIDNNNRIIDLNENDSIKLRKVIYLTIISSVDFQECCHKLLKLNMKEGQEMELVNMIIECCIQERSYPRFFGLLAERLCVIKDIFKQNFEMQFENQYIKVHRFETNKLRNLAKLFAHLLYTNAIDWSVFRIIKLTEEDTTASSRIFCKIVFQELSEYMGLEKLNDKLQEHAEDDFSGLFCRDNPKNTRFCINFFTSIGLGALTQDLRDFLANAEKMIKDQEEKENEELLAIHQEKSYSDKEDSESESYSSSVSRNESKSSFENNNNKSKHRRRSRSRSRSKSRSRSRNKREGKSKYNDKHKKK